MQLSWKKSPLLTCQILGLLVNTLDSDDKYPVLNNDNLTIPIQMQLSVKKKVFLNLFLLFWSQAVILNLLKKSMTLIAFVFRKLRTPKTWLDKCLKSSFSEDPSTSNMADVAKHCWNLHRSIFIIFIYHCQVTWVGKSLSYWHGKSFVFLLTHWLPVKSFLFLIEAILRYHFRCNYLANKKLFLNFFLHFLTLD